MSVKKHHSVRWLSVWLTLCAVLPEASASGALVRRLETWQGALKIADPSGITWLPESDTFLVTDSEIDGTKAFEGHNLFEIDRDGALVRAFSTTAYSQEPTGVAYHPGRKSLFITDDDLFAIFEVDLQGNLLERIDTAALEIHDPEGITVDPGTGNLWVADGKARTVHELTVDGASIRVLDVQILGVEDPEGIAFDARSGHLYLISNETMAIHEITTTGELVSNLGLKSLGEGKPKDLCLAPGARSRGPADTFFVADARSAEYPDGRIDEIRVVRRPPGLVARVEQLGDEDGFGFLGDERGFVHGDANMDGLLELGEWLPDLDGVGGVDLSGSGDRFDHRDKDDPEFTDVALVATEDAPIEWTHRLDPGGHRVVWGRLSLAVADARALQGYCSEVWLADVLLGEVIGHPDPMASDGAITLTVLDLPPAALAALQSGSATVRLRRPPGAGPDDIAIDFSRLEVALQP